MKINEIYNMDCVAGMMEIESESVDLILTDPPFNISVKNNFNTLGNRKGIDFGEWDKDFNLIEWIPEAIRTLKNSGSIIVFTAWEHLGQIANALRENGCTPKEAIQWQKNNPMPRNRDRLYVTTCEFAVWGVKGKGWTFNRQRDTYENTVFKYPIVSPKERIHPTQKNVELIKDLINIHSNNGDVVLDPFMGSGTTAIACMETGRNFIGFELDKQYYDGANNRIKKTS
jgi:DNA modification methylase